MDSPHSRDLFIVSRPDGALHAYLSRHFAGRPDVDVVSDRRYGERRRRSESMVTERRRAARRRYSTAVDLAALGVAIVTVRQSELRGRRGLGVAADRAVPGHASPAP